MNKRRIRRASRRQYPSHALLAPVTVAGGKHRSLTMQYAMVDGQRREASPSLLGTCQVCNAVMTPKCGKIRVVHWAHPPGVHDHRWEPETEWHRQWKGCFPKEWQEFGYRASSGELHVADVKTEHGLVIEFQHSNISEQERRSREDFHKLMCWVVDGLRLKWDGRQFSEALQYREVVSFNPLILVVPVSNCTLLRKWADSRVRVFFDFGGPILWASLPRRPNGFAVLMPVPRDNFLEAMIKGQPIKGIALRLSVPLVIPSPRPGSFEHFLARKDRARARRRF